MNIGMLWFDSEKLSNFSSMVADAVKYYQNKYGEIPNLCFVHPSMMEKVGQSGNEMAITIKPDKTVLPGLLWIGVDEKLSAGVS